MSVWKGIWKLLSGDFSASAETRGEPALPNTAVERLYTRRPSFTDLLPWVEYVPDSRSFLLEDGVSVGALFELDPVGTEARTERFMAELARAIQTALTEAIPELDVNPWVLQVYVQDEPDLGWLTSTLQGYGNASARDTSFTRSYHALFAEHLARMSFGQALFEDTAVTGVPWRGKVRRVRAALYRRTQIGGRTPTAVEVEAELEDVSTRWTAALEAAGIRVRRCTGVDLYQWLLPWFNPAPAVTEGTGEKLPEIAPYPGDEALPFGYDLAESLTLSPPRSDNKTATWWFDGLPHSFVSIQALRRAPAIGHLSAERISGEHVFSLFDKLPDHTVMVLNVLVKPQDHTRAHIAQVKRAAVGDSAEIDLTREEADAVEREMAKGNKLYPVSMGFYVRGADEEKLHDRINRLNAMLLPNGLQPISQGADLVALDSYLRNMPMAYDDELDRTTRRSRLVFSSHTANLLPFYGRSRGTGHPGLIFFNRGGEPMVFDPLNREDRKKNAHMLILGPTGAGKSALLVYLLQQMMAVHRPRVFIIEAGGSFSLLGEHFRAHDVSVHQVTLNPGTDVSLPPFRDAMRVTDRAHRFGQTQVLDAAEERDEDEIDDELGARDVLGEMEIAARIMITGGDEREDARMTRADRLIIRNAILLAVSTAQAEARDQVLTEDVVTALNELGQDNHLPDHRKARAIEMADSMTLFCSGLAGHFFNRPGERWPAADVTILEMGILAREGYEDQLTVAYLSMMSHINALVERHQNDERPTLVVTDEGHIITTNPLLARYVVKITKMWRKVGAWFWIATQNLEDFPDASRRMLNMMEWWLCLVMPKEEIEQVARFKDLSDEQRSLLLSARKEPGKYVEGVVLSDNVEALFRSVPPPLTLALAMTEQHEKAERAALMREHGCSELEAVELVAKRLTTQTIKQT